MMNLVPNDYLIVYNKVANFKRIFAVIGSLVTVKDSRAHSAILGAIA